MGVLVTTETGRIDSSCESHDHASDVVWTLTGRAAPEVPAVTIDICTDRFRIGRRGDNHLCIPNDTVSGHHAELLRIHDQLFLNDLNSTNGTLVNGRRVTAPVLAGDGDILHFGSAMYTLATASADRSAFTLLEDIEETAIAQVLFKGLLKEPGITPCFQPIVRFGDLQIVGYEALARSRLVGLETPDKMFRVAAEYASERELADECRRAAVKAIASSAVGHTQRCFLNTHPSELDAAEFSQSLRSLREQYPAQKLTLEFHESAVTSLDFLRSMRDQLTELDIQLAYDDFGAGQTRLMELVEVPPDVVKFDIRFIRGLPNASKQRIDTKRSIISMVKQLGAAALAEGVETQEEADICQECGFDLAQGFLFGRPGPICDLNSH